MLLERDAAEGVVAERARLAEVAVDPVDGRVALTGLAKNERALEVLVDRRCEPRGLLGRKVGRELEGGELREPEDLVRMRAADARDRALVAQQRMELAALAAEDLAEPSAPRPSASGPRCASSASSPAGVNSHTPARLFLPASVSTSSPPSANVSRNMGVFGVFAPGAWYRRRPALIRCTRRMSSPSSVGKSRFLPRRRAPENVRPSSDEIGGSNVFTVAMCDGPTLATGDCETSGSSSRTHASTSGSSGISSLVFLQWPTRSRSR